MHPIIVSKKNPLDKNVPVPYSTYYMAKTIHDLEQEHFHHKLATFAVIFFLVFLSFIVLVFSLQPKDERAQSIQTKASEIKTPQATPVPRSCNVYLNGIVFKLSNKCKPDTTLGAQFTCTNGYTGEVTDVTCKPQSDVKDFANQQCMYQSTCNTYNPKLNSFMMIKNGACAKNESKAIVVKCDEAYGQVSWATINRRSCQTYDEWQQTIRTSDVCSSRKAPWLPNPTPTDFPKPTVGETWTPTPPYKVTPTMYPTWTPTPTAHYFPPPPTPTDYVYPIATPTPTPNSLP